MIAQLLAKFREHFCSNSLRAHLRTSHKMLHFVQTVWGLLTASPREATAVRLHWREFSCVRCVPGFWWLRVQSWCSSLSLLLRKERFVAVVLGGEFSSAAVGVESILILHSSSNGGRHENQHALESEDARPLATIHATSPTAGSAASCTCTDGLRAVVPAERCFYLQLKNVL